MTAKQVKELKVILGEIQDYIKAWYNFTFFKVYKLFSGFEKGKDLIAQTLYRQRGRFAKPFVHIGMMGLLAAGVTLAPVLASSLPGITPSDQAVDSTPNTTIRDITDDGTTTQFSIKVRDKVEEYVVKEGDTLSEIAARFNVDSDTIRWENNLASQNSIKPGQILRILPVSGIVHKVARGETVYTIAKKYSSNPQAIVDFPFNSFTDDETFALAAGQTLIVPDGKKPSEQPWSSTKYVAQRTPNAGSVSATGQFAWPISGIITQYYSGYHRALDIATALGTPIVAADSGRIIVAGWPDNVGYGNRVLIDHGNGYVTLYAHMSRIDVVVGQTVKRGDQLGLEGSTGRSTGPHLHFEIRKNGVTQNPLTYLK